MYVDLIKNCHFTDGTNKEVKVFQHMLFIIM